MNKEQAQQITHELREYGYDTAACDEGLECQTALDAADRLESQERELVRNADELSSISEQLKAMTTRAESAERERDAAVADIHKCCSTCRYETKDGQCSERVWGKCSNGGRNYYWQWRGLQPQEGEGK